MAMLKTLINYFKQRMGRCLFNYEKLTKTVTGYIWFVNTEKRDHWIDDFYHLFVSLSIRQKKLSVRKNLKAYIVAKKKTMVLFNMMYDRRKNFLKKLDRNRDYKE